VASAPQTAAPALADARIATVKVTSDPTGANIREDDVELCVSTPCELTFRGDGATKPHKLLFQKLGFRPETKTVGPKDAPVTVHLTRAPAGAPQIWVRPPPTSTAKSSGDTPPAASGYKDLPY
jgi:serine/threonine-protein kinase